MVMRESLREDVEESCPRSLPESVGTDSLRPHELAHASVLGGLCAAIAITAVALPHAGWLGLLGAVPMGLLAYRFRVRVVLTASVAAGVVGFLTVGLSGFGVAALSVYVGGLTGYVKRKGRGLPTVLTVSTGAGLVVGTVAVIALTHLSQLRQLVFGTVVAVASGPAVVFAHIPHMNTIASALTSSLRGALNHWEWLALGGVDIAMLGASVIGWWALSRILLRLPCLFDTEKLELPTNLGPIQPLPLRLEGVRLRYPHTNHDALRTVSLELRAGDHIAVTGPNGSGKSTLMRVLAGCPPTSGVVDRPGEVGLGQSGGTAVVLQHPESQVLGMRVADDVVWGLPPGKTPDIDRILDEVGLAGFAERDTSTLSGGELQRLALAAALAREPALLIADEVTSMVDQEGREALPALLRDFTRGHRTALVNITHSAHEARYADRALELGDSTGHVAAVTAVSVPEPAAAPGPRSGAVVLELRGVGHVYSNGTPWAHTALRDISLVLHEGDGLLLHGGNGSGKSTLAWVMAGLTVPTTGRCLLDGRPVSAEVGAVALQFQAARLQLMRSRVDLEVASAAGFSPDDRTRVHAALAAVGLEEDIADRRIDQLSGGQMRPVVLAGLLARMPRVLILDEPLAGLDTDSQRDLIKLLTERRRDGLAVVVISHDSAGLEALCPRTMHLDKGRLQSAPEAVECDAATVIPPTRLPTRREARPLVLLRPVPGRSAIHDLWAGTKVLIALFISIFLTIDPGWAPIGTAATLVLVGAVVARIPRGALPSVPHWLWMLMAIVGSAALLAGGAPIVGVGASSLGLGGFLDFLRITALSLVLLGSSALVSWTTHVADIAPAIAALGRGLRVLRVPVDDWSAALALTLRTFPMLIDEFRVLAAVRRLRPQPERRDHAERLRHLTSDASDVLTAAITVTLRRADEMGDAITARGGAGQISATSSRPSKADWLALLIVFSACAAAAAAQFAIGL